MSSGEPNCLVRTPRRTQAADRGWYQILVLIKPDPVVLDILLHKANRNIADAQNKDRGNPDKSIQKENPAPQVLPKKIGLSDHYGRKEANCVEDAPKAG